MSRARIALRNPIGTDNTAAVDNSRLHTNNKMSFLIVPVASEVLLSCCAGCTDKIQLSTSLRHCSN